MEHLNLNAFSQLMNLVKPAATAVLRGNDANPALSGTVRFYPAANGTLVAAEVFGLPPLPSGPFYAFHIHSGADCGSGAGPSPFEACGMHYNPTNQPHPMHAGDLPPLLGDNGYAYLSFFTSRFKPEDIVGKTVIVHAQPDDFRTQPSGNAGIKIACGQITGALQ